MAGRRIWAFESGILWAMDDISEPARITPRVATIFAEVGPEGAEELAQAMRLPSTAPVLERLSAGKRCFAGWVDGNLATYGWVSQESESIGELERDLHLEPGSAYIWDCATLAVYRGQRLYSALLLCMVDTLRGEGAGRIWIGSSITNRPSWHGFLNVGFQPVLNVTYARLLKVSCFFMSAQRGAPAPLVKAACQALLRPDERAVGPLAFGWS